MSVKFWGMSVRDFQDIDVAQCHYNDTMKRKPFEVRLLINALPREGRSSNSIPIVRVGRSTRPPDTSSLRIGSTILT
jgi:hypothetical protein